MRYTKSAFLLSLLAATVQANAQNSMVVTVPATSNIFYAGTNLTPPGGQCTYYSPANGLGNGTYPPALSLPAGLRSLQIEATNTSDIRYGMPGEASDPVKTPDGRLYTGTTVSRNPSGTMPGLALNGRYGMLAAVFLDSSTVTTGGTISLLTYTPAQMNAAGPTSYPVKTPFFIGDGTVVDWPLDQPSGTPNGTQQRQTITVPSDATRLFFGLADASGVNGNNTCYGDNSGAILAAIAMAVSDDEGTVAAGTASTAVADVRANDYLEGAPPTSANATLTQGSGWPAGIALNTSTGAVTVAASVAAGDYGPLTYSLCDPSTTPSSCADAEVTVHVTASPITDVQANYDSGTVSTTGGTAVADVRANDTIGGAAATSANSTIAIEGIWPTGITLNPTTGAVSVASGTATGSYTVAYKLCDQAVAGNCKTTNVQVQVNAAGANAIAAVADTMSVAPTFEGAAGNVLTNDTVNGAAASTSNATVSQLGTWPAGVTLDSSGNVNVTSALGAGTYTLLYQLCEAGASPANCTSATVTVTRASSAVPATGPVTLGLMALTLFGVGALRRKRQ